MLEFEAGAVSGFERTLLGLFALMSVRVWRTAQIAGDRMGTLICAGVLSILLMLSVALGVLSGMHRTTTTATDDTTRVAAAAPVVTAVSLLRLQPDMAPGLRSQVVDMIGRNISTLM